MRSMAYQEELCPALPTVVGNVDYQEFRATLLRIDEILERAGIEGTFVCERIEAYVVQSEQAGGERGSASGKALERVALHASRALRCNIARELLGESCRGICTRLADSPLLQRFCKLSRLDTIQVPSKSALDRYEKMVDEAVVRKVVDQLNRCAADKGRKGRNPLELSQPLDVADYFLDTTCVEANIHFPVDWVLFRDAARSLIQAVVLIRKHGLRHRMPTPQEFLRHMNRLSMEMTHVSRKEKTGKKERMRLLRRMKRLLAVSQAHAVRYRDMLRQRWPETGDLTRRSTTTCSVRRGSTTASAHDPPACSPRRCASPGSQGCSAGDTRPRPAWGSSRTAFSESPCEAKGSSTARAAWPGPCSPTTCG